MAHRLGYCDRYLFSRQFKQVMGVPTRLFRRGAGAEPQWNHIADEMNSSPLLRSASRDAGKRKEMLT